MKLRFVQHTLIAVCVLLIGSIVLNAWAVWQIYGIYGWRDAVFGAVSMNATLQALDDFEKGHLRLYVLDGESEERQFTGRKEGVFEVWRPQFYPMLGRAHTYATQQFVQYYNRKMRYMHSHPDQFRRKTENVQQDVPLGVR